MSRKLLQLAGSAIALAALVLTAPLLTQETFDPARVQPSGCQPGQYNCGFQPMTEEEFSAIPPSDQTLISHRGLPGSVDLSAKFPPVGNQGQQGSCVAWATTYNIKSYQEQAERNWGFDSPVAGGQGARVFSPAWTYNQINGGRDNGSVLNDALNLIVTRGAAPWKVMPYTDSNYTTQPSAAARTEAARFRGRSYRAIRGTDVDALKAELAAGNPIAFGIPVDDAFYQLKSQVYDRRGGQNYGGHAMAVVGYDDSKRSPAGHTGAFKIINSWGSGWGDRGYGWISYRTWQQLQPQALVLYDVKDSGGGGGGGEEPAPQPEEQANERLRPPAQFNASKGQFPNKIALSWSQVNGAVAYVLFRSPAGGDGEFQQLGYSQTLTYDDTAVQAGVAFKYAIVAVASQENYSDPQASPVAEGFAAAQPQDVNQRPGKVVGVSARLNAVAGGATVGLNWTQTAGAQSYTVARYDRATRSWKVIGQGAQTSYVDRTPVANARNFYAVRAQSRAGAGPWSDAAQIEVGGQSTPPEAPQGLAASQGIFRDKIEIEWNAVPGATSYAIFRYSYEDESWSEEPQTATTNRFTDSDAAVASGAWFAYTVVAINSAGHSEYAQPVPGRTNPNATRAGMVLPPPKNLTSTINAQARTTTLRWERVNGTAEYYVFRKERNESDFRFIATVPGSAATYTDRIPETGKLYFYTVTAKSALGGESEKSNAAAAFVNTPVQAVASRALPGQGFERFAGRWTGELWEASGPVKITVELKGDGARYTGSYVFGNQAAKTFAGGYAVGATALESGNGLSFTLLPDGDLASVHVQSGALSPQERRFTLTRE